MTISESINTKKWDQDFHSSVLNEHLYRTASDNNLKYTRNSSFYLVKIDQTADNEFQSGFNVWLPELAEEFWLLINVKLHNFIRLSIFYC